MGDPQTGVDRFAVEKDRFAVAHNKGIAGFQKRFSELRRASLPPWSPVARFDHFYRPAAYTRVASTESGKILRQGDPLLL